MCVEVSYRIWELHHSRELNTHRWKGHRLMAPVDSLPRLPPTVIDYTLLLVAYAIINVPKYCQGNYRVLIYHLKLESVNSFKIRWQPPTADNPGRLLCQINILAS